MTIKKQKQGFSLIEVMLILLAVSIVIAASMSLISRNSAPVLENAPHGTYRCFGVPERFIPDNITYRPVYYEDRYNGRSSTPIVKRYVQQCSFKPPVTASVFEVDLYGAGAGGYDFLEVSLQDLANDNNTFSSEKALNEIDDSFWSDHIIGYSNNMGFRYNKNNGSQSNQSEKISVSGLIKELFKHMYITHSARIGNGGEGASVQVKNVGDFSRTDDGDRGCACTKGHLSEGQDAYGERYKDDDGEVVHFNALYDNKKEAIKACQAKTYNFNNVEYHYVWKCPGTDHTYHGGKGGGYNNGDYQPYYLTAYYPLQDKDFGNDSSDYIDSLLRNISWSEVTYDNNDFNPNYDDGGSDYRRSVNAWGKDDNGYHSVDLDDKIYTEHQNWHKANASNPLFLLDMILYGRNRYFLGNIMNYAPEVIYGDTQTDEAASGDSAAPAFSRVDSPWFFDDCEGDSCTELKKAYDKNMEDLAQWDKVQPINENDNGNAQGKEGALPSFSINGIYFGKENNGAICAATGGLPANFYIFINLYGQSPVIFPQRDDKSASPTFEIVDPDSIHGIPPRFKDRASNCTEKIPFITEGWLGENPSDYVTPSDYLDKTKALYTDEHEFSPSGLDDDSPKPYERIGHSGGSDQYPTLKVISHPIYLRFDVGGYGDRGYHEHYTKTALGNVCTFNISGGGRVYNQNENEPEDLLDTTMQCDAGNGFSGSVASGNYSTSLSTFASSPQYAKSDYNSAIRTIWTRITDPSHDNLTQNAIKHEYENGQSTEYHEGNFISAFYKNLLDRIRGNVNPAFTYHVGEGGRGPIVYDNCYDIAGTVDIIAEDTANPTNAGSVTKSKTLIRDSRDKCIESYQNQLRDLGTNILPNNLITIIASDENNGWKKPQNNDDLKEYIRKMNAEAGYGGAVIISW